MSFVYNGSTFTPHSTAEHASDILQNINDVLKANNVQVGGILVQFTASIANVVWILCLAVGAMRALYDQILFAASKMFSVSECSDAQMLAVLPLSGTELIPAAYTQVTIQVTAAVGGDAVILTGDTLPFGTICDFEVLVGATVPAGTTVDFLCQASITGSIEVAAGVITEFTAPITNVQTVTNALPGVTGRDQETVQQVRGRLLQGNIADIGIDGTIRALKSIQGITAAALYFNFDPVNNLLIPGGIVVPPRYAYMVLLGSDITGTAIAAAYARRMSALTIGAFHQDFVTQSGQALQVNYDLAAGHAIHVRVYYDPDSISASGFEASIRTRIINLEVLIGQQITAAMIDVALADFPYVLITGAEVSEDGITFGNEATVPANKIAAFSIANIEVLPEP
jgi:hypothetical protein